MSTRRTLGRGPSFSPSGRRAEGLLPAEWAALVVDDDPAVEVVLPVRDVSRGERRALGSGSAAASDPP